MPDENRKDGQLAPASSPDKSPLWRRLGSKFWGPFLVACALVLLFEALLDHMAESGELPGITQSVFNVSFLYRQVVAAPRSPLPRYTAVVEINPKADASTPSMLHLCEQRGMTARLLRVIAQAFPRAIVLDKHYEPQPNPCPTDGEFMQAIRDLREANIPVIVGRRVAEETVVRNGEEQYYLRPSLEFWSPDPCPQGLSRSGQGCMEGVTSLSNDTRKVALEWRVYEDEESAKSGHNLSWHDTLALSAARAYDPRLVEHHPRLVAFIERDEQPYVSFFSNKDIEAIPAGRLLSQPSLPAKCDKPLAVPVLSPDLRKLSGKVVLVGEINWDADSHPSVVGKSPGLYLQANYIEALLDDRYFRPMPILDYVVGFLILLALELILTLSGHGWIRALLITALFVVSIGILYLFIKLPGWYVNPGALGAVAIAIKLIQPLFGRAEKAAEAKGVGA